MIFINFLSIAQLLHTNKINRLQLKMLTKTFSKKFINLTLNLRFFLAKMTYFRQMAAKLSINLPKLNEQITIDGEEKCLVYGIKQIGPQNFLQHKQEQYQKKIKTKYFDKQVLLGFEISKNSRQFVEYNIVKRIASQLQLDICLMKQSTQVIELNEPNKQQSKGQNNQDLQTRFVLSLTKYRQYIYRQYYLKELKNRSKRKYIESQLKNQNLMHESQFTPNSPGSFKNRMKSIRIGQDVHKNDLSNKKAQIQRWMQQGQRNFKIIAINSSDKSRRAIQQFCLMFEKQVQIVEEKVIVEPKKKPIKRLCGLLQFSQQISVDIDFINRRWRRRQAQIHLNNRVKTPDKYDVDLSNQDSSIQSAYLTAFQQAGIPYPQKYGFLNKLNNSMQKEGMMGFVRQANQQIQVRRMSRSQQEILYEEGEPLSQSEQLKQDKENRKIMGVQTVEDIVEEMEQLKSREYEMEQFQSVRYKELQKQLREMLKRGKIQTLRDRSLVQN